MEHCWGKEMQQTTSEVTASTLWDKRPDQPPHVIRARPPPLPPPPPEVITDARFRPDVALTLIPLREPPYTPPSFPQGSRQSLRPLVADT